MKREKYFISSSAIETQPIDHIEITKKQFHDMLKQCQNECKETTDFEFPLEENILTEDLETYTRTRYAYECGTYILVLYKLVCKAGYCFTK